MNYRTERKLNPFFAVSFFIAGLCAVFSSCVSSTSWSAPKTEDVKGNVKIASVSAEKNGDRGSLEEEVRALLPLFFAEEAYRVVPPGAVADYTAGVRVREREYHHGWRTRRSLSCEVMIWSGEADDSALLPISAGRSVVQGNQSFASSATLGLLLRKAVENAFRVLPEKNMGDAE